MSTQMRWLVASCLLASLSRASSSDDAVGGVVSAAEGQAAPISFRVSQAGGVQLETMEDHMKTSAVFAGAFDLRAVMHEAVLKQKPENAAERFEPEEGALLRAHEGEQEEESSSCSWLAKLLVACVVYVCYKQKAQLYAKANDAKLTSWRARSIVGYIFAQLRKIDPVRFYLARRERPPWLVKPNGQEINTLLEAVVRLGEIAKEWRSPPAAKDCTKNHAEDLLQQPSMMRVLAGFKDLEEEDDVMTIDATEEPAAVAFPERGQAVLLADKTQQQAWFLSERENTNPFLATNDTNPFYAFESGSTTLLDGDFEQGDLL